MEKKNHKNQTSNHQNSKIQDKRSVDDTKNGNKQKTDGIDVTALLELVKKYKRYIAAGALFVAMVVILAKCTGPVGNVPNQPVQEEAADQADMTEAFQIDAIPEVNTLISDYYKAYAAGDVTTIERLAQPVSETEKSYIKVFSEYVDSYDNLSCYTKSGLSQGEYVVSVYLEMKFKDVATAAPGLDFFYLRTNESGQLYIDNAYSQFNQSNMENSTAADVQALINEFEKADDVVALQAEVQQKYEQAIAADAQLSAMADQTIPNAIETWVQSLTQAEGQTQQPAADDPSNVEENINEKPEASDPNTPAESAEQTDQNTEGKAVVAYAMDGINLRKEPGTDKEVITQIALGDKMKIYPDTQKDGWIKVTYDGKKGYVKREYVTTKKSKVPSGSDTANQSATALPEGKKVTLSDSVNVRVSMSETADKVGLAYQGDTVTVIQSYAEGWTKVQWNGETGYIKTELIK